MTSRSSLLARVVALFSLMGAGLLAGPGRASAERLALAFEPTNRSIQVSITPTTKPKAGPAIPVVPTTVASSKSKKTASKSVSKTTAKSTGISRTASGRVRPPSKPSKNVTPGKVSVGWSVQTPLTGWEKLRTIDWPTTGEALGIVAKKTSLDVRRGPSVGEPGLRFAKGKSSTGSVTFLVIQDYGNWVQVALPVRPNGTVGWVLSSDIQRLNLGYRVVVELASNTLIVEHLGNELWRESVASGTGNTPTPVGLFFVREVVKEIDTGPYGPYVFGLSGYSEVLFSFKGGEGAIAIHGTDAPGSIGSNASFGCIRVTNDSIRNLVRVVPLGTPVEIVQHLADLPVLRRSRGIPDPEPFSDVVVIEGDASSTPGSVSGDVVGEGTDINDAPPYNAEMIDLEALTTTPTPTTTVPTSPLPPTSVVATTTSPAIGP